MPDQFKPDSRWMFSVLRESEKHEGFPGLRILRDLDHAETRDEPHAFPYLNLWFQMSEGALPTVVRLPNHPSVYREMFEVGNAARDPLLGIRHVLRPYVTGGPR